MSNNNNPTEPFNIVQSTEPPCWQESPREWCHWHALHSPETGELRTDYESADARKLDAEHVAAALTSLFRELFENRELAAPLGDPILALAAGAREFLRYSNARDRGLFLTIGHTFFFPASPEGVRMAREARAFAERQVQKTLDLSMVDSDSEYGPLTRSLEAAAEPDTRVSAILESVAQRTSTDPHAADGRGFRFRIGLSAPLVRALPRLAEGGKLPSPLLRGALLGRTLPGSELLELVQSEGWCFEGTTEFLDRARIQYESENGELECYSCGATHESEEEREVTWIQDVEVGERELRMLDAAGYLDEVTEHFEADGPDGWSALLEEHSDADILDLWKPSESGLAYDPELWSFEPEYECLEGLDTLESAELIRILPLLQRCADAYAAAGQIPPMPGVLLPREPIYPRGYNPESTRGGGAAFKWDPEARRFSHRLTRDDTAELLSDASGSIVIRRGGAQLWLSATEGAGSDPSAYEARVAANAIGPRGERIVRMAQGETEL